MHSVRRDVVRRLSARRRADRASRVSDVRLGDHRVCTAEQVLSRSMRRALSREGLLTALALGVFYGTLNWLFVIPIIYLGSLVSYYFVTVHHVGAGGEGLPSGGEAIQNWGEIRSFAFGGLFCVALALAPLIAVAYVTPEPLDARMVWTLLLVAQIYMPAVVLSIALTNTAWAAIWPPTWIRVVSRAPGPYVRFLGMWIVTLAIGIGIAMAVASLGEQSWIVDSIAASVWTLFWILHASIVGEYIRSNAEAFGWE